MAQEGNSRGSFERKMERVGTSGSFRCGHILLGCVCMYVIYRWTYGAI